MRNEFDRFCSSLAGGPPITGREVIHQIPEAAIEDFAAHHCTTYGAADLLSAIVEELVSRPDGSHDSSEVVARVVVASLVRPGAKDAPHGLLRAALTRLASRRAVTRANALRSIERGESPFRAPDHGDAIGDDRRALAQEFGRG